MDLSSGKSDTVSNTHTQCGGGGGGGEDSKKSGDQNFPLFPISM